MSTYFVICDIVVRAHSLNLCRREHPADVVDNFNICWRRLQSVSALLLQQQAISPYLLQLKQLGGLHQMF